LKIVIGSVLKPLTDVRHYHKIALSLLKIPASQVYILARCTTNLPVKDNLHFKSITPASVSLINRLSAPYKFLYYLFKVAPTAIVVCTHELLLPALFYKWYKGCILIYDVQENYRLNIKSNSTYNPLLKRILAFTVKTKERLSSQFVNCFWLAEQCYKTELSFVSDNNEVFENKSILSKEIRPFSFRNKEIVRFVFSGTIAEETGINEAITLITKLHKLDPKYSLTIVGCCHDPQLLRILNEKATVKPYIKLKINNEPINYESVIKEIQNSDLGIISYRQQENFNNKVPTKLYEYLSLGLPVILQGNEKWEKICNRYDAAIVMDFTDYDPEIIHQFIQEKVFYSTSATDPSELTWFSGENDFINSFLALLPK